MPRKTLRQSIRTLLGLLLFVSALGLSVRASAKPGFPVLGYLPNYATYGPYGAADGAINLNDNAKFPWDRLTHVMEAFAHPTATGAVVWPFASRPNLVLKAHQNNTRAILSIGGADPGNAYGLVSKFKSATGATYRSAFVTAIANAVNTGNYDGVDIDWEFPDAGDQANFTAFMTALGTAIHAQTSSCGGCVFQGQPKQLTFFGSPGADICGVDWDNASLQAAVDFCVYGGYDFSAPPGYNSPTSTTWLQTDCRGIQYNFCLTQTTKVLTGVVGTDFSWPKSKLVIALPMYDKQSYASFTDTPVLVALRQGTYLGFNLPQDEARYSLAGSTHYVNNDMAYCKKMAWALGQGMAGFALWEISHAYPANATELTSLWDTIGGTAACVNVPTPTPGPTPALIPPGLVEIGSSGTNANLWGGTWSTYAGSGGSSITMTYTSTGYGASSYHGTGPRAVCGYGNLGTGAPSSSTCLQPACAAYNLTSNGYTRIDFWFKATPGQYRLAFDRTTTRATGNDHYGFDFDVLNGNWNYYSYYFEDSTQPSWATADPKAFTDVIAIVFAPAAGFSSYSMCVDDLELVKQVVTATPTPPAYLLDTIEDGNSTNNWGGGWSSYAPAPSTVTQSFSGTGFPFSPYGTGKSVRLYGNHSSVATLATSSTWLSSANAAASVNLTAYNYLNFYFKGNGVQTQYSVGLERASAENWVYNFTMPATTDWVRIEVPLVQSSWQYSWGGTANSWGLTNGRRLYWYSREAGAYDFSTDDIWFENRPPTPTPTYTPSFTVSPTRTASPTPSASPTFTATLTATRTSSPSASPSATPTSSPTLTASPTASPTRTITETFTPVPVGSTDTPTSTVSPTWSATRTVSPSATPTFSATLTATPSYTPPANTFTHTPTRTITMSFTASPASTATPSHTPTITLTSSNTFTITPTFSFSPSLTATPSHTVTLTPSPSFTSVPPGSTATHTPTISPTSSATPNATQTAAVIQTLTQIAVDSRTPTPTPSFSETPAGPGPTATHTPTWTNTAVAAPGGTLQVLDGVAFPNPAPQSIRVKLDGPADRITVRIYTVNMQLVGTCQHDPGSAYNGNWTSVPLPADLRASLAANSYYFEVDAVRGATRALKPLVGTFVHLR